MKKMLLLSVTVVVAVMFLSRAFAADYTRWHLPEGAEARLGKGWINAHRFSPDGTQLAVGTTIGIWIYDVHKGEELHLLIGEMGSVKAVAYYPGGDYIASAHADWTVRLWDISAEKVVRTFTGHEGAIHAVDFSSDGAIIASGSSDKTIRMWDTQSGELLSILPGYQGAVYSVTFSPDGKMLAGGSEDTTIRVWHTGTGAQIYQFTEHTDSIRG